MSNKNNMNDEIRTNKSTADQPKITVGISAHILKTGFIISGAAFFTGAKVDDPDADEWCVWAYDEDKGEHLFQKYYRRKHAALAMGERLSRYFGVPVLKDYHG